MDDADKIKRPIIRESIIKSLDRLQNNYKLIKLDDRAALPFALDNLSYTYNGITVNEVLKGIGLR